MSTVRLFAEDQTDDPPAIAPWKVLVADDEDEVHKVTRLALTDFRHAGRPLALLHAYSGAEAVALMREHPDTALVLMDVVMESEHAGLDAVLAIRHELRNTLTRIVVRTGQPGRAPEELVTRHYGVNDYKEKTEITARKLHTLLHNSLSLYRELTALDGHKQGLEKVIGAATTLQAHRTEDQFARVALEQLTALLFAEPVAADALLVASAGGRPARVLAGTGRHAVLAGGSYEEAALDRELRATLDGAMRGRTTVYGARAFTAAIAAGDGAQLLLHVAGDRPLGPPDTSHIALFCRNVATTFENLQLLRTLSESQRNLILLLSTAIEQRSRLGGGHGQRVAVLVRLLGELHGLPEGVMEWLPLAATLHDIGHIAIPEAILNKPADLTPGEQALFETHTRWGRDLLWGQDSEILRHAGLIAGQHHEHWDGSGYPSGLEGEGIHLYARITGLANAFDEMLHPRHGRARPLSGIILELERQAGKRFDPLLVHLLLKNIDKFMQASKPA